MVGPPQNWSELPVLLLLSVVLRLPSLTDFFSFAAVCRSWRSFLRSSAAVHRVLSTRYLSSRPPLLLIPPSTSKDYSSSSFRFQSIADSSTGLNPLLSPESRLHILLGYSHGHLLLLLFPCVPNLQLLLSDPFTGLDIKPPFLPPDQLPFTCYYAAALTAPPSSPDSIVLVLSQKTCVYHRLGSGSSDWSTVPLERKLDIICIFPFKNNQRVYAINRNADKLIELSDQGHQELTIKVFNVTGFVLTDPSWKGTRYFDQNRFGPQLGECDGELLLVLLVLNGLPRKEVDHVDRIDVYRMDFVRMKWLQAECVLDEYALFIDSCGRCPVFCSEPERWGGRRNCAYVAAPEWESWREFGLDGEGRLIPNHPSSRRLSYSEILQCLPVQGSGSSGGSGDASNNSGLSRGGVKERFKSFNMQFEELHQRQSQWAVPDPELRESLRLAVAEVLLPAYRSFVKRFGPLIESGKNPQKYIRYTSEDLDRMLGEFFDGRIWNEQKR